MPHKLFTSDYVSASSFTIIKSRLADFKRGRAYSQDEHRSTPPDMVTTPETAKKIHKVALNDRRLKLRELEPMVDPRTFLK